MTFNLKIETILNRLVVSPEGVTPLSGDASARHFFRLATLQNDVGSGAVLIIFPEGAGEEDVARYIRMAEELGQAGLPVPKVYQKAPG